MPMIPVSVPALASAADALTAALPAFGWHPHRGWREDSPGIPPADEVWGTHSGVHVMVLLVPDGWRALVMVRPHETAYASVAAAPLNATADELAQGVARVIAQRLDAVEVPLRADLARLDAARSALAGGAP